MAPPAVADPCLTSTAPFFCDWVRTQLRNDPALGSTQQIRDQRLLEGGLTIRTTLDPAVQAAAQNALNETVEPSNSVTVAEAIVQPGTGNVLAMAVNKPYGTGPGETTIPVLDHRRAAARVDVQGLHADGGARAGAAAVDLVLRARLLRLADLPHRYRQRQRPHPGGGLQQRLLQRRPGRGRQRTT